ncbi:MAG: AI-2E family transporter [Rhizobiaceae bacterium]|nr:AI-2E family transporter [Rhizobiaceae bacterium]
MPKLPVSSGTAPRPEVTITGTGAGSQGLIAAVVVVGALYFGREIFVPLALAILLAFVLSPFISLLRVIRIPRTVAVISVVLTAFLAIFAFGFVIAGQVAQLGNELPRYQTNIREKIQSFRANAEGSSFFEHTSRMLDNLSEEISGRAPSEEEKLLPGAAGRLTDGRDDVAGEPIPVQIRQPDPEPLEVLQSVLKPLISPLATAGIVIVFVIFMLLQREDLRDRFIRLAGGGDLHRTTQALSDAGRRVAKYLLMQLIVNATYGIPVGMGLWIIGVPNPLLWGMLAMVMRFVPYIGPVIAAMVPLALAVAVDPGWSMLFWTVALFIVLELVSNNVVEPWLYGSSTGLSPVAIIVAAIFWTWLWGPIGLLLSTPLTVCLVVLGQHVPQFGFLDVLLGSQPVLTPQESLYQRLLAGDPAEATERAEDYVSRHSLLSFYDDVAIPALKMTEEDRARGVLDESRRGVVVQGAYTLIDNFSDFEEQVSEEPGDDDPLLVEAKMADEKRLEPAPEWQGLPVLCAGGRGNIDDAAAAMLAQSFTQCGIGARTVYFDALDAKHYAELDLSGVAVICLSFMNANSIAHARFLVRRLRRRTDVPILVGFWSMAEEDADRRNLVGSTHAELSATSLRSAIEQVKAMVRMVPARSDTSMVSEAEGAAVATATAGLLNLGGAIQAH